MLGVRVGSPEGRILEIVGEWIPTLPVKHQKRLLGLLFAALEPDKKVEQITCGAVRDRDAMALKIVKRRIAGWVGD